MTSSADIPQAWWSCSASWSGADRDRADRQRSERPPAFVRRRQHRGGPTRRKARCRRNAAKEKYACLVWSSPLRPIVMASAFLMSRRPSCALSLCHRVPRLYEHLVAIQHVIIAMYLSDDHSRSSSDMVCEPRRRGPRPGRMNLQDQSVRAGGDRGQGHRRDQRTLAGAVTGIER